MSNTQLDRLRSEAEELGTQVRAISDAATEDNRDLSEDETATVAKIQTRADALKGQIGVLVTAEQRIKDATDLATEVKLNVRTGVHAGNGKSHIYGTGEANFLSDILRARVMHDPEAERRVQESNMLARAEYEAHGVMLPKSGIIIPSTLNRAFVTSDLVPVPTHEKPVGIDVEARPFLDTLRKREVISETVHIPTVDAALAFDFQTAQNAIFTQVDLGATDATYTVKTLGVFVNIPIQAIDFASVNTGEVLQDLQNAYDGKVDTEALRGAADTATSLLGVLATPSINTVDGSGIGTWEELYKAIAEAIAEIGDATFSNERAKVVMSRRRAAWFKSGLTDKYPALINTQVGGGLDFDIVVDANVAAPGATPTESVLVYLPSRVWFYEANGGRLTTIEDNISVAHYGQVRLVARNYVNFPGVRPRPGSATAIENMGYATFAV